MTNRKYLLIPDAEDSRDFMFTAPLPQVGNLPSSMDLRENCPVVYDQGSEGSCTSHAGCACRTMLTGNKEIDLSRAFLYYQERVLEGTADQDSGASMRSICKATQKFGICPTEDMPYIPGEYQTPPSEQAVSNAKEYTITDYKRVNGIDQVKAAVALRSQPVLIGMPVYESMESTETAQTGILPMPGPNEKKLGNHAVLVVGYSDQMTQKRKCIFQWFLDLFNRSQPSSGYFIVRNSWGESWGDKGYFRMPYEYFNKYAFDFWIME